MIDKNEVKDMARLSEIEFDEKELEEVIPRLNNILDHVGTVCSVDTKNIKPTSHVIDIHNVFREDEQRCSLSRDDALKNAPDIEENGFRVPETE